MKYFLSCLAIAIAFCFSAHAQPRRPAPIVYELACPAGYSQVASFGKSFNSSTGQWRANVCISDRGDGTMLCQMSGCGAPALPVYLKAGTPTSQGNECAAINTESNGTTGTVTAIAAFRTIDGAGVGHDLACIITASSTSFLVGQLIFPGFVSNSTNAVPATVGQGALQSTLPGGGLGVLTNNGGVNRVNAINFRSCALPGCPGIGTDLQFTEDPSATGKEDYLFKLIGGNHPLYFGNRLNAQFPGICLGSSDASTGGVFCLKNVAGKLDHIARLAADADMWNSPLTMVAGTVSYPFNGNFTATTPPVCLTTWQGTGTLTGIVKCTVNGSSGAWTGITISSSVNTDTAAMGYEILGNNN
jgi:hypothetical protein